MRAQNVSALKATFERFGICFLGSYGLKWTDGKEQNSATSTEEQMRPQCLDVRSAPAQNAGFNQV
jgi:hypothetical protein